MIAWYANINVPKSIIYSIITAISFLWIYLVSIRDGVRSYGEQ